MLAKSSPGQMFDQMRVFLSGEASIATLGLRALLNGASDVCLVDGDGWMDSGVGEVPALVVVGPSRAGQVDIGRIEKATRAGVPVLAVSQSPSAEELSDALRAGALGYICGGEERTLLAAIEALANGQSFVCAPGDVIARLREPEATADRSRISLTPREREVLALMARGHTNRMIAEALAVSPKTVEAYRTRLSDKTGRRRRSELIRFAFELGLVSTTSETAPPA